jgi:lipopolysaccharide/colanic/teichoic acid biosynthesis glycosyltransferase
VFYRQERCGEKGQTFQLYKLRTMRTDAEKDTGPVFARENDARVTAVGAFLRRHNLDELPQLWNVLKGDMSLVGPRPPVPQEVDEYSLSDRRRLEVIPGITCIWQVSGRSDIPFDQQVELDVQYIQSQSFWTDIKILLKTVPALLFGSGAY